MEGGEGVIEGGLGGVEEEEMGGGTAEEELGDEEVGTGADDGDFGEGGEFDVVVDGGGEVPAFFVEFEGRRERGGGGGGGGGKGGGEGGVGDVFVELEQFV